MPASDSNLSHRPALTNRVIAWARQAGDIALGYFKNVTPEYKPDQTFLTEADLEVERFLTDQIRTAFSDHTVIGEEGELADTGELSDYVWAIDPIDGTTAFVQGLPGWGVSIGLFHQGQPHFGLFYMPLLDDLTYGTTQGKVYSNGRNLKGAVRRDWRHKAFLAINSKAHYRFKINLEHTRALGSIGANLVYTARGAAAASFIPKACVWDLAAGAVILTEAGGALRYLSGKPIDYTELFDGRLAPEPIIAGHPDVLATLPDAIKLNEP